MQPNQEFSRPDVFHPIGLQNPQHQAYRILQVGFVLLPIITGVDKFFHFLVNWDKYLAPVVNRMVGGHGHGFMLVAGVVEIAAGIGVALKPTIFAYVVAAWLLGIIINLLLIPGFYDVALRDFGLFLGALALARLSAAYSVHTANK
ncbi:MAG: hypothetical protein HKL96_03380 [Phycisphaerales bacterium]|nr:hypothetical protein [Phycisphaerales bacterium]